MTSNLNQLSEVAKSLLQTGKDIRIFCFYGEMGSGKTTLIKELCKLLDVQNLTTSPTFSIVNEYHTKHDFLIYHFDLYRLNSESEWDNIGGDEYLYSGNYCFIEWPELIESQIDESYIRIDIHIVTPETRQFTFTVVNES